MSITNEFGSSLDPTLFTFDPLLQDFSVSTSTVTGSYNLWLIVYNDNYFNSYQFDFTVHLSDPCDLATITIAPSVVAFNPNNYLLFYPIKTD